MRQDVLYVNFACGRGCPASLSIDEGECETKLRDILAAVQGWTEERLFLFETEPERFDHCWDRYRMACMVAVLQWKFNMLRDPEWTFEDGAETARNTPPNHHLFAQHLMEAGWALCLLARRVLLRGPAPGDIRSNWSSPSTTCSLAGTTGQATDSTSNVRTHGFLTPPDEYYKTWPEECSD